METEREASEGIEQRDAKVRALRAALIEGEQSGPSGPFDIEAFIARKRATALPSDGPP